MKYPHLASPGRIGALTLPNRFIMTAMGSNYAEEDGRCGERLKAYYEERARGGAGLIILETSSIVWPAACSMPNMVGLSHDNFLPDLQDLVSRVHKHGSRIAAQLNHSGKVSQEDVAAGRPLMVPSLPPKAGSGMFKLLTQGEIRHFIKMAGPDGKGARYQVVTEEDIAGIVQSFADAAERCQRAGFDAVEVHAGHGYLLAGFLSPAFNQREDRYGGSLENRARFLIEVITAIKQRCGSDYPVLVRLDAMEYRIDGGIRPDSFIAVAKLAENAGADAIDVSAYGNTSIGIAFTEAPLVHQPNGYLAFAQAAKKALSIPVMAVGRIELDSAESAIANGDYDFVGLGRKILADPALPQKVTSNRPEQIRPCIYCYICVSQIFINQPMMCAVNADMGHEHTGLIACDSTGAVKGDRPRHVVVVGGGPGGMEAARRLALGGHRVTLMEKAPDLGGTARIAALAYEPNGRLVDWLSAELKRLNVAVQLNTQATIEGLKELVPDQVIVATGARREAPDIPGKNQRHVFDGEQMRSLLLGGKTDAITKLNVLERAMVVIGQAIGATRSIGLVRWFSRLWMPVGHRVIIVGGGLVGIELAEFLVERGRLVTVLDPDEKLAPELSIVRRARVLHELEAHGCSMYSNVSNVRCERHRVTYEHDGEQHSAAADSVILALGAMGDTRVADSLANAGLSVSVVGDCGRVGYIDGAIHSAREVTEALMTQWQQGADAAASHAPTPEPLANTA